MNLTLNQGLSPLEIIAKNLAKYDHVDLTTPEGKEALACAMYELPQCEDVVFHFFSPGIYIRECHVPGGALVVGEDHTTEHLTTLLSGEANLFKDDGTIQYIKGPHMFVAGKGRKLAFMLTNCVWQNTFATTETDIPTLERTLVNPSKSKAEYFRQKELTQ